MKVTALLLCALFIVGCSDVVGPVEKTAVKPDTVTIVVTDTLTDTLVVTDTLKIPAEHIYVLGESFDPTYINVGWEWLRSGKSIGLANRPDNDELWIEWVECTEDNKSRLRVRTWHKDTAHWSLVTHRVTDPTVLEIGRASILLVNGIGFYLPSNSEVETEWLVSSNKCG